MDFLSTVFSILGIVEQRDLIQLLTGILVGLLGWMLSELWKQHKELDRAVNTLEKRLPAEFSTKAEVKETKDLIGLAEGRLNAKIDHFETSMCARIDALSERISDWFKDIGQRLDKKADRHD